MLVHEAEHGGTESEKGAKKGRNEHRRRNRDNWLLILILLCLEIIVIIYLDPPGESSALELSSPLRQQTQLQLN
jgi:hypothetical protein